jgi:hypothetical protein
MDSESDFELDMSLLKEEQQEEQDNSDLGNQIYEEFLKYRIINKRTKNKRTRN